MALAHQRNSRVSERKEELKKLFHEWDSGQTGVLSMTELSHMMNYVFPPTLDDMFLTNLQHQQYLTEDLRNLTQRHRVEEGIDFETFWNITKQLEQTLHEHHMRAAFAFFDAKGDGVIDREELSCGLAALEFPHVLHKDGHLKAAKLETLTDRLMQLGDPKNKEQITFANFSRVQDEIRHIHNKKQHKVENLDHTL